MAKHSNTNRIRFILALMVCGLLISSVNAVYPATPVKDLAIDPKGRVYAATWGGIYVYDQDGNKLRRYTKADGLPTNILTSVCAAPDGTVWFGSTHGVIRLSDGRISTFTVRNGLNDNLTYSVAYSPTLGILAGTERGVSRLVGSRFEPLDDEHEFARRRVYDIHIDRKGDAWFAKEVGLSRYANERNRTVFRRDMLQFPVENAPVRNEIFCVTTDRQNRPWVGTRTGISWYNGKKWQSRLENTNTHMGFSKILSQYVTTLCFSADGELWTGHGNAANDGITVMRDGSWKHLSIGNWAKTGSIYKIRSFGGRMWLATTNGICYYSEGRFVRFPRHQNDIKFHGRSDPEPCP